MAVALLFVRSALAKPAIALAIVLGSVTHCAAQPAQSPQSKPGATIIVNPTEQECNAGWHAGMKWTKPQFDEFCDKLRASK